MSDRETRALLAEALDFFNDHPNFSLRRDRRRTSYELASRIDGHLRPWAEPPHPAIGIARDRWGSSGFLRIDDDERMVQHENDDCWVRAWIRIGTGRQDQTGLTVADRYRKALGALPSVTRDILHAHQQLGQSYDAIAEQFGMTTRDVEHHIAEALAAISDALTRD